METKEEARKRGKRSKIQGSAFEKRVRQDLEEKGFIVAKWMNNIKEGECRPVKNKFLGPGRPMMLGAGFPDFIAYKHYANTYDADKEGNEIILKDFQVVFVESKMNGYLDPEEREKARWYLEKNYCSKFLIAYKVKEGNRVVVKYEEFDLKQ